MQFEARLSILTKLYAYTARKGAEGATKKCAKFRSFKPQYQRSYGLPLRPTEGRPIRTRARPGIGTGLRKI